MLLLINATFEVEKSPLRACYCSEMHFLRYEKAPAGMLLLINGVLRYEKAPAGMILLGNAVFEAQKNPCGNVTAHKCYL